MIPTATVAPEAADSEPWTLYSTPQRWAFLVVLFLTAMSSYIDRNVIAVLLEPIRQEFGVSDTLLGLFSGAAFALLYAVLGVPVAKWADRGNRRLIITLALSLWSVMTALCGAAQSFVQLAMARVGVGIGEAGAVPPSHSLLVDYFPVAQRGRALAVFTAGTTMGAVFGYALGGYVAAKHGWRWAFLVAGLPGLLIALMSWTLLREPRDLLGYPVRRNGQAGFATTLKALWQKPSYRCAAVGISIWGFFGYGALVFTPSYLVRVLGLNLATVGGAYGALSALTTVLGTLLGGYFADRLSRRDVRWLFWFPAGVLVVACPLYAAGYQATDFQTFLTLHGCAQIFAASSLPPVYTSIHRVCGSTRRATAMAVVLFLVAVVGSTLGPLVTGLVSDALKADLGVSAIGVSLQLMCVAIGLAALVYGWGGSQVVSDVED